MSSLQFRRVRLPEMQDKVSQIRQRMRTSRAEQQKVLHVAANWGAFLNCETRHDFAHNPSQRNSATFSSEYPSNKMKTATALNDLHLAANSEWRVPTRSPSALIMSRGTSQAADANLNLQE